MNRIEFLPYPPTSFPYRDLLVLELLRFGAADRVCEIGVGSGGTTARLARICGHVTGFDVSAPSVEALRYLEKRHRNLELVVADITQPTSIGAYERKFTHVVSCDTLEHVADPAAFFNSVEMLLQPGGNFIVTFPNEPRAKMHGITRFDTTRQMKDLLRAAGLTEYRIGAARLTPAAKQVAQSLGWSPLRVIRRALDRTRMSGASDAAALATAPMRTFDETHFFKRQRLWRRFSPVINLYWFGVLKLMSAFREAFEIDWHFQSVPFTDCQVVVIGRRSAKAGAAVLEPVLACENSG